MKSPHRRRSRPNWKQSCATRPGSRVHVARALLQQNVSDGGGRRNVSKTRAMFINHIPPGSGATMRHVVCT